MIVVQLATLEEFIGELQAAPDCIIDKMVRWRITRTPEQREAVSFQVAVWATALLRGGEDADYLLEFGQAIGSSDSKTSPIEVKVNGMEANLKAACDLIGLQVRPGKIEVF